MRRRDFLWITGAGALACTVGCDPTTPGDPMQGGPDPDPGTDASPNVPVDANSGVDACAQAVVKMHDTYAQALYLDGTNGPLTGIVEVAMVTAGVSITIDFWHGHGGQQHRYTLGPAEFAALKQGERVTVGTTTVDNHAHTLFIDPLDEAYRVPGAPDIDVPLGFCEDS